MGTEKIKSLNLNHKDEERLEEKNDDEIIITDEIRDMEVIYEAVGRDFNNEYLITNEIKNMEVVYEILNHSNDEVLITDEIRDTEVFYDVLDSQSSDVNFEKVSNIVEDNDESDIFDIEVVDPEYLISEFDSKTIDEVEDESQIEFNFELPVREIDFQKKGSDEFKVQKSQEDVGDNEKLEELDFETNIDDEFNFELKGNGESEIKNESKNELRKNEDEEKDRSNTQSSAFDQRINETLPSENEKRKEHLKKFNYSFTNSRRIDELEKQPAYKRMGLDLESPSPNSDEENSSRISIDEDCNEEIQLRSNNSFLHDNVD